MLMFLGILGLGVGLLIPVVHPTRFASTAAVHISPHVKSFKAQVIIAQSDPVRLRVARALHLPFPPSPAQIEATAPTKTVIDITITHTTPGLAQSEAEAAARSYLNYVNTNDPTRIARDQFLLDVASPAQAVRPASSYLITGMLGLLAGIVIALLVLGVIRTSRGRTRPAALTA